MSGPRLLTENQLSILLNFGNAFDAYRNAIIDECAKVCEAQAANADPLGSRPVVQHGNQSWRRGYPRAQGEGMIWLVLMLASIVLVSVSDARLQHKRREAVRRGAALRLQCVQLVAIDRAQTVSGQAFENMDDILFMGSILDLDGLPPVIADHPRWWIRRY